MQKLKQYLQSQKHIVDQKKPHKRIEKSDSNRYVYISVHSHIIHNSTKVERTQMSINR